MEKNQMDGYERVRSTGCLFAAALVVLGCSTPAADSQGAPTNNNAGVCDQTTQAAAKACDFNAQSDFWIAVGSCDNLADAGEKAACSDKAQPDLQLARDDCQAQTAARQQLCQALGQAPYDPKIHPQNFVKNITNPFLPLKPGTVYVYDLNIPNSPRGRNTLFVTRETVDILDVTCVVVHDTVEIDGHVTQDTFDYVAQDKQGNVWYFGSDTMQLEDDVVVGVEGSWQAGVDGAQPGLIMKAEPEVGDEYRQNFALGNAEDAAKVVALDQTASVPFGSFRNALKILEFSALEPDARKNEYYVPNIGNVLKVDLVTGERYQLMSIEHR
jgi:hypothetical protein